MKIVRTEDLKPGMRLARNIYQGDSLLVSRANALDDRLIERLQSMQYNGSIVIESREPSRIRRSHRGYRIPVLERAHGPQILDDHVRIEGFVQEGAQIFTCGDISIDGNIEYGAMVVCTGTLRVSRGVDGGLAIAGRQIDIGSAGTPTSIPTLIGILDYGEYRQRYSSQLLSDEIHEFDAQLARLTPMLSQYSSLARQGRKIPPQDAARVRKALAVYTQIQSRRQKLLDAASRAEAPGVEPVSISVRTCIHPGTRVRMGTCERLFAEETEGGVLRLFDNDIRRTTT